MTYPIQTQFELARQDREPDSVLAVVHILLVSRDWMTAADILRSLGRPDTETDRRWVRKMAEDSGGDIISGQRGYRHTNTATIDEKCHAGNWLISQGNKMRERGLTILRAAHTAIG
jgi:hypothetical protein